MIFGLHDPSSHKMATLKEEVKFSSLPNNVLKSKNVAKKSTTKLCHSRSSSRSGSPCSMPPSLTHSREPSPDGQASVLNGKLKVFGSTEVTTTTQDTCKTLSNGPSSLTKQSTDEDHGDSARSKAHRADEPNSTVIRTADQNQSLTSTGDKGTLDTAVSCSNGNLSDGSNTNVQTLEGTSKTGTDSDMVQNSEVCSSSGPGTVVKHTVQIEKEAATCPLMSKSNFIQAKDALRERLKAAMHKYSSDKSFMGTDKCSDGDRSPTPSNKSDQGSTPNRCSSPVTPRSSLIDKGNLFEIMTLDLGKSSLEPVAAINDEGKSASVSMEKQQKCISGTINCVEKADSNTSIGVESTKTDQLKDAKVLDHSRSTEKLKNLSEDVLLPSQPDVTVEAICNQSVDEGQLQNEAGEDRHDILGRNADHDEEMLLLGVSDSNENFDTIDDSILDEEPKKSSSEKSEQPRDVSLDRSDVDTIGYTEMLDEITNNSEKRQSEKSVPAVNNRTSQDENGSGNEVTDMVIDECRVPCENVDPDKAAETMECSPCDTTSVDSDNTKLGNHNGDLCCSDTNKRKLSTDSLNDVLAKRGRTDSVEKTGVGITNDGKKNVNNDTRKDINSDVKQDIDIKREIDSDIKPDTNSDHKPITDSDTKESVIQCNGDRKDDVGHPNDDTTSRTTVKDSGVVLDHRKSVDSSGTPVKPEVDGVVKISRQALENLISKSLKERLASSETVHLITDLQSRVDKLTEQLYRCKATAKSYQIKLADLTKSGRTERRRTLRGPVRHVGIQVDIVKQQASHVPGVQKSSPRSQPAASQAAASPAAGPKPSVSPVTDSHAGSSQTVTVPQPTTGPQVATYVTQTAPTIAPKISGIGQSTVGGGQTFLVPVAGASANGTMTLIGPPSGTNLSSSQYRFTPVQPAPKPTGVTVREMLDSKQSSSGTLPVSQVNITTNTGQSEKSGVHEKVIDLTEDEENNTSKVPLTPITLAPGQVIVQSSLTSTSNSGNIPTGTYLVPVTSGQPIILQSVVQPQLQQPLVLSTARPGISQQQIAPAGQQLVTLTPAQGGIRPLLVQTPAATQSVSTAKVAVTTQVVTKSVPPAHPTTVKPVTSKQMKHPAPLPPQPTTSKISPEYKTPPPKPKLTISRVPQGIVLSWNLSLTDTHAAISNYQLYAYQEGTSLPVSSLWKRVGDVKALPLPMACTLTQFHEGNKYHFAVRGVDEHGRIGPFSDPNSIHLAAVSTS